MFLMFRAAKSMGLYYKTPVIGQCPSKLASILLLLSVTSTALDNTIAHYGAY